MTCMICATMSSAASRARVSWPAASRTPCHSVSCPIRNACRKSASEIPCATRRVACSRVTAKSARRAGRPLLTAARKVTKMARTCAVTSSRNCSSPLAGYAGTSAQIASTAAATMVSSEACTPAAIRGTPGCDGLSDSTGTSTFPPPMTRMPGLWPDHNRAIGQPGAGPSAGAAAPPR